MHQQFSLLIYVGRVISASRFVVICYSKNIRI